MEIVKFLKKGVSFYLDSHYDGFGALTSSFPFFYT